MHLCRRCHIEQHTIGWFKFAMKYAVIKKELILKGWKFTNEFGVKKLRRVKE